MLCRKLYLEVLLLLYHNTSCSVETFTCITTSSAVDTGILKTIVKTFIMPWHLEFQWLPETKWPVWVIVCYLDLLWASHAVLSYDFLHVPTVIPNMWDHLH